MYIALSTHTTAKDNMWRGNLHPGGGLSRCSPLPSYVLCYYNFSKFITFSRAYFYYINSLQILYLLNVKFVEIYLWLVLLASKAWKYMCLSTKPVVCMVFIAMVLKLQSSITTDENTRSNHYVYKKRKKSYKITEKKQYHLMRSITVGNYNTCISYNCATN